MGGAPVKTKARHKEIEHIIVGSYSPSDVSCHIRKLSKEGWELHGHLCIAYDDARGILYSQTMIKPV